MRYFERGTGEPQAMHEHHRRLFPSMFRFLPVVARVPGAVWLLAVALRPRIAHRSPMTFGLLSKRPIAQETMACLDPAWRNAGIRRDLRKFLVGVHPRHTQAAAQALQDFAKPVLLVWATEDKLFPISLGHRLAALLPSAKSSRSRTRSRLFRKISLPSWRSTSSSS